MDSTDNTPNQKSKATFDPGWNDPPQFSYNAQHLTPGRPRNFLNKRVAFPLSDPTSSLSRTIGPTSMPPMPTSTVIPSMPPQLLAQTLNCPQDDNVIDSENILREVKGIMLTFLDNGSELGSKANDIKRRISIMEEMWLNGKLTSRIQLQMKELACALRDDIPSKADDIHRALMVDQVGLVGTWMPAVKQLIHHCIARSELLAIDREDSNGTES